MLIFSFFFQKEEYFCVLSTTTFCLTCYYPRACCLPAVQCKSCSWQVHKSGHRVLLSMFVVVCAVCSCCCVDDIAAATAAKTNQWQPRPLPHTRTHTHTRTERARGRAARRCLGTHSGYWYWSEPACASLGQSHLHFPLPPKR